MSRLLILTRMGSRPTRRIANSKGSANPALGSVNLLFAICYLLFGSEPKASFRSRRSRRCDVDFHLRSGTRSAWTH